MQPENTPLEARLLRLEEENRRLRRHSRCNLLGVLGLACILLLTAAGKQPPRDLAVRSLSIRDSDGQLRARLGPSIESSRADSSWVEQILYDAAGTERIRFGIGADGTARQRLFDEEGHVRVSSSTYAEGHAKAPGVAGSVYYDKSGAKRIRLATDARGRAVQQFKDGRGEDRLVTAVDAAGEVTGP